MAIPKMAKIVYRQMPAPRELSQQIPGPRAKARMQNLLDGGKFLVQIPQGCAGGWLWMKLIPALEVDMNYYILYHHGTFTSFKEKSSDHV